MFSKQMSLELNKTAVFTKISTHSFVRAAISPYKLFLAQSDYKIKSLNYPFEAVLRLRDVMKDETFYFFIIKS